MVEGDFIIDLNEVLYYLELSKKQIKKLKIALSSAIEIDDKVYDYELLTKIILKLNQQIDRIN